MKSIQEQLSLITERLKILNLYKVILFGSFAYGQPDQDSDIDLIVITKDEFFPKNYEEKSKLYQKVSNLLTDFSGKIPIDLIVYTKAMFDKFIVMGSLFSKEILQNGVILYEADHEGMAEQSQR